MVVEATPPPHEIESQLNHVDLSSPARLTDDVTDVFAHEVNLTDVPPSPLTITSTPFALVPAPAPAAERPACKASMPGGSSSSVSVSKTDFDAGAAPETPAATAPLATEAFLEYPIEMKGAGGLLSAAAPRRTSSGSRRELAGVRARGVEWDVPSGKKPSFLGETLARIAAPPLLRRGDGLLTR